MFAYSFGLGQGTSNMAEALALLYGLKWCVGRGYDRVWEEMDSLLLVKCINGDWKTPWRLDNLIQEAQQIVESYGFIIRALQPGKEVARQDNRAQFYAFSGKIEGEASNAVITGHLSAAMTSVRRSLIETKFKGGECLEEAYLQATKDKKFKLKQHLQNVRLGTKKIDEYIKKFKGICDGLTAIHKPVDEDNKVINFDRGLGLKYKTFKIVMSGKAPYPTLNQFVKALMGFDIRVDE
ncbi:hypothetical protein MTR67_035176 [Solanum verrucosum]|uniref:RNase H type-1 domain-containing protein n=1 Tax=Solanum verrucosum TaxID=315347 RepID=A0AAF0ZJJ9_SOLVR|nr:hypothetical protein MTR67_035176 [Solanum verrucosum]